MRQGDLSRGEELLTIMDDIYGVLITIDFPDAITGGLRRTTDMVRGVLERTRSDLTLTIQQKALENKLETLKQAEFRQEYAVVQASESRPAKLQQDGSKQYKEKEPLSQEEPELDSIESELYLALAEWRERKGKEESLATYIIAKNSRLEEIVKLHPQTTRDLYEIKGLGERWINKYGREIIAIINKGRL
jgi:superfamily II DNA helicase RecQ